MTFDAIGIAGTGLTVHRKWLDAISDNIAISLKRENCLAKRACKRSYCLPSGRFIAKIGCGT